VVGALVTDREEETALRVVLLETADLLERVGETHWQGRIRAQLTGLSPSAVLGWYGGMGSFTDLLIDPINGHRVEPGRERELNDSLDQLRQRIYELAHKCAGE